MIAPSASGILPLAGIPDLRSGADEPTGLIGERALLVIDGQGIIRWSCVVPIGINPGTDGMLTALETMHAGGTTP